jgi:hypothetical protein
VNDASEPDIEEHAQNDERGHNSESMAEKDKEDAPNLDELFKFLDDTDPILEMDEANDDPTDEGRTVEEEEDGRAEKEVQVALQKPSKRRSRGSIHADANVDEGSPKKKEQLPHRIRRKRRKGMSLLLLDRLAHQSHVIPVHHCCSILLSGI